MYSKRTNNSQSFFLPRINKPNSFLNKKQPKSLLKYNNSLINYESQLKIQSKLNLNLKLKQRMNRLKTLDVNQNQSYDDLRRQLKSIKHAMDYKFNQYNHKIQNKIIQYTGIISKKQLPHVIYQPYPMVVPFISPHISRNQSYEDFDNFGYSLHRFSQNKFKSRKKLFNPLPKLTFIGRKFKIAAWAIIFMNRLKKFNKKIILHRKQAFHTFIVQQFTQEANSFKKFLVQGSKQFLTIILQKQDYQLRHNDRDSENFIKQKIIITHKIIDILINSMKKTVQSNQFDRYIRLIYFFCRHGSFACIQNLLTIQQLENLCVSEKNHYIQAEKNLQKSQIINFMLMKILIYNVLGKIQKVDSDKFSKQKQILHQNVHLIASIFYELLMMIQDDYIVSSPQSYKLGNFTQVKAKIYPSDSLTVKPGQFRKNQIISGLIHQNYLKSTYKLEKQWVKERNGLIQIIQNIHNKIVEFHCQFIKPFL